MMKKGGVRKYAKYRRPPRQAGRGRRLRWLAGAVAASLVLVAVSGLVYRLLTHSPWFQVAAIDIEGNSHLRKEQVLELSDVDIHSNLVALSSQRIRERLAGNAWVASAEVTRHWPNRLQIRVRERTPVAILNREGHLFYMDRHGLAFTAVHPGDDLDFPVISGVGKDRGDGLAKTAELTEALQFLRYAGGGDPNLPAQNISEINIGDPDCLVLYLMSRPFPIRLGRGEMKRKYERLTVLLSGLYKRREFGEIAYIDTVYRDGQILVRLTGG